MFDWLDCWRDMGRQNWWEACVGFWSSMVVNSNYIDSNCCKNWASFSAYDACFHGDW